MKNSNRKLFLALLALAFSIALIAAPTKSQAAGGNTDGTMSCAPTSP